MCVCVMCVCMCVCVMCVCVYVFMCVFIVFTPSGVGTRNYYRKIGYELDGPYMSKLLSNV